jgi:hypothetical protein
MDDNRRPHYNEQTIQCECGKIIYVTRYEIHRNTNSHYRSMTKQFGLPYPVYGETGQHGWTGTYDAYDLYPDV